MPIFVSYSHSDKDFVDRLAAQLVKANARVWIDRWELHVGDSLIRHVQKAITDASAMLIVLSKASVESEWCKKELDAGLIRELEEKRVVVLPLLIEDCIIPVFLRDKIYADFRHDFDAGLKAVLEAVAKITSDVRGRLAQSGTEHTDWSLDWGYLDGKLFRIIINIVIHGNANPFSVLLHVTMLANAAMTARYRQYEHSKLDWVARQIAVEYVAEAAAHAQIRVVTENLTQPTFTFTVGDLKRGVSYDVEITGRVLGEDTGREVVVDIGSILTGISRTLRDRQREPTAEEKREILRVVSSPYPGSAE